MNVSNCPLCGSTNVSLLINLGEQPPANELKPDKLSSISTAKIDVSLMFCYECCYVWLRNRVSPERLYSQNPYLTGVSLETRQDMKNIADTAISMSTFVDRPKVLEIGSNDGTLLSLFRDRGFDVLGIDPSKPAAEIAKSKGIPTLNLFFNPDAASEILDSFGLADLIIAANVITHLEDPIDFLNNCKKLLKPSGTLIVEFYYFESIISNVAFDQIYHEHISYFNFTVFLKLIENVDLVAYNVEYVKSQGGSLRVYLAFPGAREVDESVLELLQEEGGYEAIKKRFIAFPSKVIERKAEIISVLNSELRAGHRVAGYGASAKATALLNYIGMTSSNIVAIGDKNPMKQRKFIPGVGISIVPPEELDELGVDFIIIFSWNLRSEIVESLNKLFSHKLRAVSFMPDVTFYEIGG